LGRRRRTVCFFKNNLDAWLKKRKTSEHRRTDARGEILKVSDGKIRNGITLLEGNNLFGTAENDSTRKDCTRL